MDATTPASPAAPSRAALLVTGAALALCALEVALSFLALQVAAGGTTCPDLGHGLGCSAVFRPRLSRLVGPLSVTQVAFVGSMASLGLALILHTRPAAPRGLVLTGLTALGLGAGFALGLQPLSWLATGALCALCLTLAACALGVLVLGLLAARRWSVPARVGLAPLVLALAVVTPLAARHGQRVAEEDVLRVARARRASGDAGPRLLLVTQPGCPYCDGLLADVLADERVLLVLQRTRGLEEVRRDDPRAPKVDGTPTLVVLGADGRERGRLEGYSRNPEGYARRLMTLVTGSP